MNTLNIQLKNVRTDDGFTRADAELLFPGGDGEIPCFRGRIEVSVTTEDITLSGLKQEAVKEFRRSAKNLLDELNRQFED